MITIRNYRIQIKGQITIVAEKDPVDGVWALSSEPPGLLEQLLITNFRSKRKNQRAGIEACC